MIATSRFHFRHAYYVLYVLIRKSRVSLRDLGCHFICLYYLRNPIIFNLSWLCSLAVMLLIFFFYHSPPLSFSSAKELESPPSHVRFRKWKGLCLQEISSFPLSVHLYFFAAHSPKKTFYWQIRPILNKLACDAVRQMNCCLHVDLTLLISDASVVTCD